MVSIDLEDSEALVLFEFLARFGENDSLSIDDPAERYALWSFHGLLEKKLVEPFKANYQDLLDRARAELRTKLGGEDGEAV